MRLFGVPSRHQPRRPLWQEIVLSSLFTLALIPFGAAAFYVGTAITDSDQGGSTFTVLVFLFVVLLLVAYAYPSRRRRWYHWVGYELCVVLVAPVWIPLIYLPWLIVTQKESRR